MKTRKVTAESSEKEMTYQIQISAMPQPLLQFLVAKGLTTPRLCFNNCFLAVMNDLTAQRFQIDYALAWVTHPEDRIKTSHAILKSGDKYYDPTLESQGLQDKCEYVLEKAFSAEELVKLLGAKFGMPHLRKMLEGQEPWWPLCQTIDGKYEFVDAPLPTAH